jgi:hypothetical protein
MDADGRLTQGAGNLLRIHAVCSIHGEQLKNLALQVFIGDRLTTDTDGASGCSVSREFLDLLFEIGDSSTCGNRRNPGNVRVSSRPRCYPLFPPFAHRLKNRQKR